jgi:hypothetical protein
MRRPIWPVEVPEQVFGCAVEQGEDNTATLPGLLQRVLTMPTMPTKKPALSTFNAANMAIVFFHVGNNSSGVNIFKSKK